MQPKKEIERATKIEYISKIFIFFDRYGLKRININKEKNKMKTNRTHFKKIEISCKSVNDTKIIFL